MKNDPTNADRKAELLDVQLLDAFAEIEALLRGGRQVQREALRIRGLPEPVSSTQRYAAGRAILEHLRQMSEDCRMLGEVLTDLHKTGTDLERLLHADEPATDRHA
jgi:hypothetical protein